MSDLKVGDTIKCFDSHEAISIMTELAKEDIHTDFMYEKDGKHGIWLIVERVKKNGQRELH